MTEAPEILFRALFDNHSAVMLVIDPATGAIICANLAAAKFYGYSHAALESLNIRDINQLSPDEIEAAMEKARTDRDNCFTFPHRLASGEVRIVEVHSSLLTTEGRQLLFSIIHDVTEREYLMEALRASEARHRSIFEHSLDGILLTRPNGSILAANPAACRILQRTEAEICAAGRTDIMDASDPRLSKALAERKRNGRAVAELVMIRKDGSRFPARISSQIFRDEVGEASAMIFQDISGAKQAEEALRHSEERFRILCNTAPVGIFQTDVQGNNVFVNPCWVEIAGLTEDQALGQGWKKVIHPDDLGRVETAWRKVIEGEAGTYTLEHRQVRPDGEVRSVKVLGSPLLDSTGGVAGYVGVVIDITELQRLQEEILKTQKLESLGVLAGGIAHDFNNILTGLTGNLSLAELRLDPAHPAFLPLQGALRATQRAADLARQILTFARGGEPVKKPVAIGDILQEAVSLALGGSNIKGCLELPSNLPTVAADEGQMHQVFSNLAINAAQATPGSGKLLVQAGTINLKTNNRYRLAAGPYLRVSLTDEGCGIPAQDLSRIFDPYFSTKPGGTGLGLATTYSIVQKHGGAIDVQSRVGKGTTMTILLPVCEEAPAKRPATDTAPPMPRGSGESVLVMDDEESVRTLVAAMLEELGCRATTCAKGEEAIDRYREALAAGTPFRLVILDLTVPGGMGGLETADEILALDPQALLVVSSGYSDDPVLARYQDHGFSEALVKPYRIADLAGLMDRVCRKEPRN